MIDKNFEIIQILLDILKLFDMGYQVNISLIGMKDEKKLDDKVYKNYTIQIMGKRTNSDDINRYGNYQIIRGSSPDLYHALQQVSWIIEDNNTILPLYEWVKENNN